MSHSISFLLVFIINCFFITSGILQIPALQNVNFEVPYEDFVYFLDDSNFNTVVNKQPIIVVNILEESFNHKYTKKLDFDITGKIAAERTKIPFAVIDLATSPVVGKRFKTIRGSTVKIFVAGDEYDFFGPYDPEEMVVTIEKYMKTDFSKSKSMLTLKEDEVMEMIKSYKISAVVVYHVCPRSEYIRNEYLGALPVLKEIYNFPVFILESSLSSKIQKRYNIDTLPELLICYRDNCYKHEKHIMGILEIVPKLISVLNNEHKINSLEEFHDYYEHHGSKLLAYFLAIVDSEKSKEFEVIEHMMTAYQLQTPIYYSTNKSLIPLIGCKGAKQCLRIKFPTDMGLPEDEEIILDEILKDEELLNEELVADYVANHIFPLVTFRNIFDSRHFKLYHNALPILTYFGNFGYNDTHFIYPRDQIERTPAARRFLLPLAKKHRDIKFSVSNNNDIRDSTYLHHDFHFEEAILITDEYNMNYFMDVKIKITLKNIDDFIRDFKEGNVEPDTLSLEVPRISHFFCFKIAVAKTLKKCASDPKRDTILFLIRDVFSFKIHNKKELDILTHIFEQNSFLNPVIMEITGNKTPRLFGRLQRINIFLMKSGNIKKMVKYDGSFEAFEILKFLQQNGDLSVKGWHEIITDEL